MKKLDIEGLRFGKLTAIQQNGKNTFGQLLWKCVCECGNTANVVAAKLNSGHTKSCGCLVGISVIKRCTTHGQNKRKNVTGEYRVWYHIKTRCLNSKVKEYKNYGGRGIKMCDRWLNSFENFFEDMGKRPSNKHSIDRFPNKNGNYEKINCRWATSEQQARNRRNSKLTLRDANLIRSSNSTQSSLATMYDVSQAAISRIKTNKILKNGLYSI